MNMQGDGHWGPHPERNGQVVTTTPYLEQRVEEYEAYTCLCNPDPECGRFNLGDLDAGGTVSVGDCSQWWINFFTAAWDW